MRKLKSNSSIAIAAPAGRIFLQDLDFAIHWVEQNGWNAVYSKEIFKAHDFGYHYAGNAEHRKNQLQTYLDDENIDAIWFARGGYGSVQIIDDLDFSSLKKNPKWLIGYSDITVFHNHLNNLGIPTLHAVTAKQLNATYSGETYTSLLNVLRGETLNHEIAPYWLNIKGKARGKLVGGNLSIIYSLLGSDSFIQGEDLILFIEDWQENWYHLDRMLMAIKRSGLLSRIRGLVVGSFTKMDIKDENQNYEQAFDEASNQIIHSFVKDLNIPVAFQFPSGHIGDNRALILGCDVILDVSEKKSMLKFFKP